MQAIVIIGLFIGCTTHTPSVEVGKEPVVVPVEVPVRPPVTEKDPTNSNEDISEVPSYAKALLPLLKAHHAEDLPTKETLSAHERSEEGLQWLAENAKEMAIRSRALILLGLCDGEDSMAILDSHIGDTKKNYQLREAAFKGVSQWTLEERIEHEEMIRIGLSDDNPLVVMAAAKSAAGIDSLTALLMDLQENHPSQMVREELGK